MSVQNISGWTFRLAIIISGIVLVTFVLAPPWGLLDKADFVAAGVCHRLPEHSLFFGGRQSPLCARCTGTYLGLALSLAFLTVRKRLRGSVFPPPPLLALLLGFIVLWGIDGLNSYINLLLGIKPFYEPTNLLRLITGGVNGISWGLLITPFFNKIMWQEPRPVRSIENLKEMSLLLLLLGGLLLPIYRGWPLLIYPLALLSLIGPLMLLGAINTMLIVVGLNLSPVAHNSWRELTPFYLIGVALAVLEVLTLNGVRFLTGF